MDAIKPEVRPVSITNHRDQVLSVGEQSLWYGMLAACGAFLANPAEGGALPVGLHSKVAEDFLCKKKLTYSVIVEQSY
jgi:hypothetical protein